MKRALTAAVLAAGLALGAVGCGVQPTGAHVAFSGAITASNSGSPSPSSSVTGAYTYWIFLAEQGGGMDAVPRVVSRPLDVQGLVDQLAQPPSEGEQGANLRTGVPYGLRLTPDSNAKQSYYVSQQLDNAARTQIACTLDLYWKTNAEQPNHSTRLLPYKAWDDCSLPTFATWQAKVQALGLPALTP